MKSMRQLRLHQTIPLLFIMVFLCPVACGNDIYVDDDGPADFDNIQTGIDAADYGDTVSVAPGTYYENIRLKDGVNLLGAGADVTIIDAQGYGDVVDARANNVTICGFTLRNSGEDDLWHTNCGVYVAGGYFPVITNNVIVSNKIGIGIWNGAHPDIRNNIILNNSLGLYIYGKEESPSNPEIHNNTIVYNEIGGITLRVMVSPKIVNNIIAGHITGINHNFVTGSPKLCYNNLWDNDVNYSRDNTIDETLAGPGSISVDPYFAKPGYWADIVDPNVIVEPNNPNAVWVDGDYHLKSQAGRYLPSTQAWIEDDVTSPCIDAGDPNSSADLEPSPNGGIINMGAYGGTVEASKSSSNLHNGYGGGTGGPNDPYLIYTAEHLNTIGTEPNDWDKHFMLMDDIDLSGYSYDNALIAPDIDPYDLSFNGISFTGSLDGNGHTISNLTITGGSYLGLFGHLESGAEVKNLRLLNINITGSEYVGGLVGFSKGTIATSYVTGTVNGDKRVGGLTGRNWRTITQSCNAATVTGNNDIGGLAAANYGRITDSYNTGSIAANIDAGGLVGENYGNIATSYSTGPVTGPTRVGGLVGYNWEDASVSASFWNLETSGQATSAGGTGKTTTEMQTDTTFLEAGWDFVGETTNGTEDIWWILEGQDYPRLWWEAK
jgi:parallel beta-helix repeat protein